MSDFSQANGEVKLQRVPKWLCNRGTGRTHRLRFIRRQNLEKAFIGPFMTSRQACKAMYM